MSATIDGECDYCGAEDALTEYVESSGEHVHICDGCLARESGPEPDPEPEDDDDDGDDWVGGNY